ncbi:tRNA glutamyl-Q(34) synthetase GluQRS [Sphingosinicella sp. YJ22]|uniref:tRNA glutamyl-Q(34) synthetase GluQRS n=1 Tax=Sphingosinicella sp. YJ22 TaxID=1104780 RepID=UPI001FAEBF80|nr:tRNA glutamyl-Q(34) synthetase GluQRS [Sphingosinicella sp. YJ22]
MMTPQGATRGQEPISASSTAHETATRFAPSPTGPLHLGHAYSAILAHDFARARGGIFMLRIEDIDPGRSRPEHVDAILEDLAWLGLDWDGELLFQSERLALYQVALDRLRGQGLVYPCFCTRSEIAAEIAASASAPHPGSGSGTGDPDGPVYPGTCRALSHSERYRLIEEKPHAWRLDMTAALERVNESLSWCDHGRAVAAEPERFGDVVLARKDAPASYHLAVTIDDSAQGITDIVRGQDLFAATHVHRLLQALLGLPVPHYHHHDLIRGNDGQRLAKRNRAPTIASLRAAGADPRDLAESLRKGALPAGYSVAAD